MVSIYKKQIFHISPIGYSERHGKMTIKHKALCGRLVSFVGTGIATTSVDYPCLYTDISNGPYARLCKSCTNSKQFYLLQLKLTNI